jgi:hypothetical protein
VNKNLPEEKTLSGKPNSNRNYNSFLFLAPNAKRVVLIVSIPIRTGVAAIQIPAPCDRGATGATRPEIRVRAVIDCRTTVEVAN